jgi:hypothetical protein
MEGTIVITDVGLNSVMTDYYDTRFSLELEGQGLYEGRNQTFGRVSFEIFMDDQSENHRLYDAIRMGRKLTATLNIQVEEPTNNAT